MWKIPLSDIAYDEAEQRAVREVLDGGWLSMGPRVALFEERFAATVGTRHAVAVTNCTAALHLAMLALGLGPGDEAVCPSVTFVAGANVIVAAGAKPVFADIEAPARPTVCRRTLEACLTPRTKALQVMHYAGFSCAMEPIMELSRARGIPVVEDCAHSLDAFPLRGLVGCYSFFPNKNMTTGEGGMLATNDDAFASLVRKMRSHGMTSLTWDRHKGHAFSYDVDSFGLNYRMDELRAALGLAQLGKLADLTARRRRLAGRYRERLAGTRHVTLPFAEGEHGSWHIFPILVPAAVRPGLMAALRQAGIQSSIHYPPAHLFRRYRELLPDQPALPVAEAFGARELTLPLHPGLDDADVDYVVDTVTQFMAAVRDLF